MYIWSGDTDITYSETEGCLALFFQNGKQPVSASYPVGEGNRKKAIQSLSAYIKSLGLRPVFRNLSVSMVQEMQTFFPDSFTFIEDRAAADYLYETKKMITLSGKKLHSKRNHYNYFKNTYNYTYRSLHQSDMADCMNLFEQWVNEKDDLNHLGNSRQATERLLLNFENLPVQGGGIYIKDELVAFSIGEPVSTDTVLIHLEFAADLRGAFNAINLEFCSHEWKDFLYVNREEDMGLPGLRQAKLAYRPVRLLEKFNAVQTAPLS